MPNWVYNTLTVTGAEDDLDRIAATVTGDTVNGTPTVFTFQHIVPRPAASDDDWYDWNITHWGTKWDASDTEVVRTPGTLTYRLSTAWAPPMPIVLALAAANPTVTVHLAYEEEQGWGGTFGAEGDDIVEETGYDIPQSHADIVARGRECGCDPGYALYDDCWAAQAADAGVTDPAVLEVVRRLTVEWEGDLDSLVATAARL